MINETWHTGVDAGNNTVVTIGENCCGLHEFKYMRIVIIGNDAHHEKEIATLISKAPQMLKMLKKILSEEHDASKSSMKRILELETLVAKCEGVL